MVIQLSSRGGYREPSTPAPVSGPGSLSRRTDGGPQQVKVDLPDARYGEQQQYQTIQNAAPIPAAGPQAAAMAPQMAAGGPGMPGGASAPPSPPIPLTAPSARPDEPVTHGSMYGEGGGPDVLGNLASPIAAHYQSARDYVTQLAAQPGASPALQYLASSIKGRL